MSDKILLRTVLENVKIIFQSSKIFYKFCYAFWSVMMHIKKVTTFDVATRFTIESDLK